MKHSESFTLSSSLPTSLRLSTSCARERHPSEASVLCAPQGQGGDAHQPDAERGHQQFEHTNDGVRLILTAAPRLKGQKRLARKQARVAQTAPSHPNEGTRDGCFVRG